MKRHYKILAATAIILLLLPIIASAQKTTRPRLTVIPQQEENYTTHADTITSLDSKITVSGYEKTLRSKHESLLITNSTDSTIDELNITVDYLDIKGRQIHQRTVRIETEIPKGETRMATFPSWDKQCAWYYELCPPPRTTNNATPYRVKVTVDNAIRRL